MEHSKGERKLSSYDGLLAEDGELFQTHVGGAALIEGIMMRGKYNWALAVRQPDNSIYTEEHPLPGAYKKQRWKRWPLLRGCVALYESTVLSYKAMSIAVDHAYDFSEDEIEPSAAFEEKKNYSDGGYGMGAKETALSVILGLLAGIACFVVLPAFITNLFVGDYAQAPFAWNVVDGFIRVAIFVLYIWLIRHIKDIARMFGYHGAEHKCIHCFEHGLELTPENCQKFSTMHVRCGTAFIMMTLLISIFVFTVFPTSYLLDNYEIYQRSARLFFVILTRIVLLPLIAGIAYELTVKWAGSRPDNPLVKFILWPGMQMQKLTTNPPDNGQLECAIAAMKLVIACEEEKEKADIRSVVFSSCSCDIAEGQRAFRED